MPVTELQYVEGDGKSMETSLLIFGGQVLDKPPILSLASLDNSRHVSPLNLHHTLLKLVAKIAKGAFH